MTVDFRRKVILITTGGTIDKDYGNGLGVRDMDADKPFALNFLRAMAGTGVEIQNPARMGKDSLDFTDADRGWVVGECVRAKHDKIIVTHGTDTMLQTAAAIHKSGLDRKCTIVMTGALRPAVMKDTDAEFNIGLALGACLGFPVGLYIAMNGVHKWQRCWKDAETGKFLPR
jgi:L-asparaginase